MCVLGQPVRYNGSAKTAAHQALDQWRREGRLVPICPELSAGFGVPRPPADQGKSAASKLQSSCTSPLRGIV
nr:2-thiouracil desulfurase family protein [Burkholderia ubonensis]